MFLAPDGRPWGQVESDDGVELARFVDAMSPEHRGRIVSERPPPKNANEAIGQAVEFSWQQFLDLIQDKEAQRRLLEVFKTLDEPITLEEAAAKMGLPGSAQVGGVISGVRKNAKRTEISADLILKRELDGRYSRGILLKNHPLTFRKNRFEKILGGNKKLGLDEDLSNADPEAP